MDDVKVHPLDILQIDVGTTFEDLSVEVVSDFDKAGVTGSYETLKDKPRIEGRTLSGNKSFEDLGLSELANLDLLQMYNDIVRS